MEMRYSDANANAIKTLGPRHILGAALVGFFCPETSPGFSLDVIITTLPALDSPRRLNGPSQSFTPPMPPPELTLTLLILAKKAIQ